MPAATNSAHVKEVYNALRIFRPDILKEIEPKLVKPQPIFVHVTLLPALLKRFCELKEFPLQSIIGINKGSRASDLKVLFIAVVIKLYDPQTLTGIHSDSVKNSLTEELAGLLKTDRTWISQKTTDIRSYLNPYKALAAHKDFKNEVNKLSKVLEIEFAK